jgi:hypothetical protein
MSNLQDLLERVANTLFECRDTLELAAKGYHRSDEEDDWQECVVCHQWITHYGHSPSCELIMMQKRAERDEKALRALSAQQSDAAPHPQEESARSQPSADEGPQPRSPDDQEPSAADYEALGRACERHGLAWFGADGEMLFQAPDDVIADAAREPLFERIAALKAENARLIRELSNFCGDS